MSRVTGREGRAIEWPGIVAFLVGLTVSIPFMNSSLYTGPMANLLHGADIAYYVGMLVAGVLYYVLRRASNAGTNVESEQSS